MAEKDCERDDPRSEGEDDSVSGGGTVVRGEPCGEAPEPFSLSDTIIED